MDFYNIRPPFATTWSFSSKFTKLSFIWYFSTFMSIFTKKKFYRRCSVLRGTPDEDYFSEAYFTSKVSLVSFLNTFFKIPKGGLKRVRAASNYYWGIKILTHSIFWGQNIKHAACLFFLRPFLFMEHHRFFFVKCV